MRNRRLRRAEGRGPILLEGLQRLEYRGYDSAGSPWSATGGSGARKTRAGSRDLAAACAGPVQGHHRHRAHAVGDARRSPNETNARQHPDADGRSRSCTTASSRTPTTCGTARGRTGVTFVSETDGEVIAHLIARAVRGDRGCSRRPCAGAGKGVVGTYGLAVIVAVSAGQSRWAANGKPDRARPGGEGDVRRLSTWRRCWRYTRQVVHLEDGELAVLARGRLQNPHHGRAGFTSQGAAHRRLGTPGTYDTGGYEHYLLKEISEQPETWSPARCAAASTTGSPRRPPRRPQPPLPHETRGVPPREDHRLRLGVLLRAGSARR